MKIVTPIDIIYEKIPYLAALGLGGSFSASIPQGNKYEPHQGNKEKARRMRQRMKEEE